MLSVVEGTASFEMIRELREDNKCFTFISNIIEQGQVTDEAYFERLSVLQGLPPYRDSLKIIQERQTATYARFNAEVNVCGLVPYLLDHRAASVQLQTDTCINGHPAFASPIRVITFVTSNLLTNFTSMTTIIPDTINSYTSEFAMSECPEQGCDGLRKRSFVKTSKEIIFKQ